MGKGTEYWQKLVNKGVSNAKNIEQVRMLNSILLIAVMLCTLLFINAFVSGRLPNAGIQLGRVTGILFAYYISTLGKHKVAFVLFIIALIIGNIAFLIFQDYNVGNSYSFLAFLLLVYYFLDDNKERVVYFVILGIIGCVYYVYEQSYMLPAPPSLYAIAYVTITILLFFLLRIFRLEIDRYKKESEENSLQLAQANEELQTSVEATQIALEAEQKAGLDAEMANAKLKSMQSQLVQTEKMGSLTSLITATIDSLNNPMNFISSGVDALNYSKQDTIKLVMLYQQLHHISEPEEYKQLLLKIKEEENAMEMEEFLEDVEGIFKDVRLGIDQTMEVLHDLSAFTYKASKDDLIKVTNLGVFLNELISDKMPESASRIKMKISTNFSSVRLDPSRFGEAIAHVLKNSFNANANEIALKVWGMGKKVGFSIQDDGDGMNESVLKKATDPFFTTHDPKKHKGLGLAVASHIIMQHGGQLEIQSEQGNGTTIFITLPI